MESGINLPTTSVVNIAAGCGALLMLAILLLSSRAQKPENRSRSAFAWWIVSLMALIACELALEATCLFAPFDAGEGALLVLNRALFAADFALYNLLPVAFYGYIASFLEQDSALAAKLGLGLSAMATHTVMLSALFACSLVTGWFFSLDADTTETYYAGFFVLEAFVIANWHLLLVPLHAFRDQFGRKKANVLRMYVWVPLLLLPTDYIFQLTLSYVAYAFVGLLIYMDFDVRQSRERALLEAQVAQRDSQMANMRLDLAMSQIKPHFLYNSLSAISSLCASDPAEAQAATSEFADYLKANMRSISSKGPIPFERELLHAQSYLKIQQRRFPETLEVVYDIRARDFRIAPLALQAMVENAVKHGAETRYEPTCVKISSREEPCAYVVTVEDNGSGFDAHATFGDVNAASRNAGDRPALGDSGAPVDAGDRPHLGIASTRTRLREMVGGSLAIESAPGAGTLVTITIPKGGGEAR